MIQFVTRKLKKLYHFILILTSFVVFSITFTQIQGMEEQEETGRTEKNVSSPSLKRRISHDKKDEPSAKRQALETPAYVPVRVSNYCKELLESVATEKKFKKSISGIFEGFFSKIPYTMQRLSDPKEAGYNYDFYNSFALSLCHCIELCAVNDDPTYKTQKRKINDNIVIYLPIRYNNNIFILQFFVGEASANSKFFTYTSENPDDKITIISINIILTDGKYDGLTMSQRSNNGDNTEEIDPLNIEDPFYKENHIFKTSLLNVSASEHFSAFWSRYYNLIPNRWQIHLEKFYQAIFANILTFIGIGIVTTEIPTWGGRADVIINMPQYPERPAHTIIVEFKFNHSAKMALDQINARQYGTITDNGAELVGINVGKKKGQRCFVTSLYEYQLPAQRDTPLMLSPGLLQSGSAAATISSSSDDSDHDTDAWL